MLDRKFDKSILKDLECLAASDGIYSAIDRCALCMDEFYNLKHIFARKLIDLTEKYEHKNLDVYEKLVSLFESYEVPSYLILDLIVRMLKLSKYDESYVYVYLSKFQTEYSERILSSHLKSGFRFPKKYEILEGDLFRNISNECTFYRSVNVDNMLPYFNRGNCTRKGIDILKSTSSDYYYRNGEFLISKNKLILTAGDASNILYDSYIEAVDDGRIRVVQAPVFVARNYTPPRNYCHWICDYLPLIHLFSEYYPEKFSIIMHEPLADFQRESLSLIGNLDIVNVPEGVVVKSDCIYYSSLSNKFIHPMNLGDSILLKSLERMISNVEGVMDVIVEKICSYECNSEQDIVLSDGLNLYISRSKSDRRFLENESDFLTSIGHFNFLYVCMEDFTWLEQVVLFRNVRNIIGVHGAALTNLVFTRSCKNLIEIFPDGYGTGAFEILASSKGINYYCYVNDHGSISGGQFANANVDIDRFDDFMRTVIL